MAFFPIHRTYFCVRHTDGAARIYFFLSVSLPERITLWSRIIPMHVKERGKKKEEEEKSPEKYHFAMTLSLKPSLLSVRPQRPAPQT